MIFQHHRFQIWNQSQHPFRHSSADFAYTNNALPGVSNLEGALDWVMAVLYPNSLPGVATPGDLPLGTDNPNLGDVTPSINDYRVVANDGDGKAASYRWEQREGDASPSWYKVYDIDWGYDSILSYFQTNTQGQYVYKPGVDDLDENGVVIAGLYAGQRIYGGASANTNLTLNANSGDGVGAQTGYVQFDGNSRPTLDNTYDSGTATERFKTGYFGTSVVVSTLSFATGSITDSTGSISFGNENLNTTGNIAGAVVTGNTSLVSGTLTLSGASITDSTGSISFGDENLSTTGTISGAAGSSFGSISLGTGTITSSTGAISFADENLLTTGTLGAGVTTVTQLNADNLRLDNNALSVTNLNGNLELTANGAGVVDVQSAMQTLGQTVTGILGITGQLDIDNIRIDANTLSSQNLNGDITVSPNGSGNIIVSSVVRGNVDTGIDLGTSAVRFGTLYLATSLHDGTNSFLMSELIDLRSANWRDAGRTQAVQAGDALFWNGSQWLASAPDAEIDHGTLSGLADDDHTQYMLLAGRAGGQDLIGGTAASNNLTLESTSNVTKGTIFLKDRTSPFTNASFSVTWSGTDLGDGTHYFRDVYTKGEFRGLRVENFTVGTLPASSAQNVGRLAWTTDTGSLYADTGTAFKLLSKSKFLSDTVWNGADVQKDVVVSADIADARNAIWALHDNANDFERMYVTIKAISATTVRIQVNPALPAGSYRLIGIE